MKARIAILSLILGLSLTAFAGSPQRPAPAPRVLDDAAYENILKFVAFGGHDMVSVGIRMRGLALLENVEIPGWVADQLAQRLNPSTGEGEDFLRLKLVKAIARAKTETFETQLALAEHVMRGDTPSIVKAAIEACHLLHPNNEAAAELLAASALRTSSPLAVRRASLTAAISVRSAPPQQATMFEALLLHALRDADLKDIAITGLGGRTLSPPTRHFLQNVARNEGPLQAQAIAVLGGAPTTYAADVFNPKPSELLFASKADCLRSVGNLGRQRALMPSF